MEIELFENAKDDFAFWKKSGNVSIQNKIQKLFESMKLTTYKGISKPE